MKYFARTEELPDYVGPFHSETRVCEIENHELPTMLRMVFDQMQKEWSKSELKPK